MRTLTLEELLEAGCHFGHQVTRQNPKARDFVFEARDNIHIIDLAKTKEQLEEAAAFVRDLAKNGGSIIVLGAKRQAASIVKSEVERANKEGVDGLYVVTNRWIGGLLTNFPEVSKNFKKLTDLTDRLRNPDLQEGYTKKERSLWEKERLKLESFYGGVATMSKTPDAVFIVDTHLEDLAVREARRMGVKTVGITDTNADPTIIDYPIPANDDAVGSIQLITSYIVDAWIEGKKASKEREAKSEEGEKTNGAKEKTAVNEEKKAQKKDTNQESGTKKQEEEKTEKGKKKTVKKPTKAAGKEKPKKSTEKNLNS